MLHCFALLGAAALIVITAGSAHWSLEYLAVIAFLTVVSGLTRVEVSSNVDLSGSFLGIVLATVLLGGGPGAIIGLLTTLVSWLRWRTKVHALLNNLAIYAWFPLLSGLFFHAAVQLTHSGPGAVRFYLLVFAAFVVALAVNFVCVASYQSYLRRTTLVRMTREALIPMLPAELSSALLTMVAVYVSVELGVLGLALFALVLVIFQHLVGELMLSRARSQELHRMATMDDLTGLANRERFRGRVEEEIVKASSAGQSFPVILMDLDGFKEVNDTLGHDYGDILLKELGPRLAEAVGPQGIVARLGGDEFAVFPGLYTDDATRLEAFASGLLECVRQPIMVEELSLELDASAGIACFPADGSDAHTLLRRADLSMYAAKEAHTGCKVYSPELDKHSAHRLSVLSDFRGALTRGEIVLHYQPIVDLHHLHVRGAEGLVRWEHPQHGLLPPSAFMPAVEQTGLIQPLTRHVLDLALAQCAEWRRYGSEMSVAVNLSVRNLLDRDLPAQVDQLLSDHSLPPDALQLEITESMIMSDPDRARATVMRLSELGVHLSVDDFGTGYSSLANLRQLPINELKIDRSFVTPMLRDDSDLIIVKSTINLGHELELRVVAEGVEDEPTLMRLVRLGADMAQGYHLSRPLSPEAFSAWMGRPAVACATNGNGAAHNGNGAAHNGHGVAHNGSVAANGNAPTNGDGAPLEDPDLGVVAH
jgi:diguanylate cyclase (GGDEF)-like protein